MSGGHGHEDHGHGASNTSSGPTHSTTKWAAGAMTGMFGILFTALFDGNGGWHDDHGHH